jgi:hypothetical protein
VTEKEEERPTCAHCSKTITKDDPIMVTTDAEGKQVAIHGTCHRAFQKGKEEG